MSYCLVQHSSHILGKFSSMVFADAIPSKPFHVVSDPSPIRSLQNRHWVVLDSELASKLAMLLIKYSSCTIKKISSKNITVVRCQIRLFHTI